MPICKKCGEKFPSRFVLNGLQKNLGNRHYCLVCSPFGSHNTQRIEDLPESGNRVCYLCHRELDPKEFYSKGKSGLLMAMCKRCQRDYMMKRWMTRKLEAIQLKGHQCAICGIKDLHPIFYDFHHRDPKLKDVAWNQVRLRSWDKVLAELEKCDLLCCFCHRLVHARKESLWNQVFPLVIPENWYPGRDLNPRPTL